MERRWPAEVTALQTRFSSSFVRVPGPEWPASCPHTTNHTHTHTQLQRATCECVIEGKRIEAFICCSALNRLLVRQGTPKGSSASVCVCTHTCVRAYVFCTCCLAAFFCQEVSNSSCVNSGPAPSITKRTSRLNKSQEFIKIAWLRSVKYSVFSVQSWNDY